ncbi:ABZJ_00895 family protein [Aureimonas pseudogalii]|uniref:Uncharacterized protein n=1 Tax=Aureimonas pseudogalii TaxID=1744844 RepID=A0A7W6H2T5_9HYPH|nr:ABZJ_00895 family protein [Aureimonas pseudogalii]MBB3997351.1 hypothetical protein [Aureimonas pseudogalii]
MALSDLVRYGLRYGLYYLALWALIVLGELLLPGLKNSSANILTMAASALGTFHFFVKSEMRLPTSSEYWSLVGVSVLVSLIIEVAIAFGILTWFIEPLPDTSFWIIVFGLGAVFNSIVAMTCYSKFFGRKVLKRVQKA